ncbi:YopT-type cysteine protease domain-containing protein [Noviherbaspirillum galbum]|uniref:Uncharacterized protein n=1 Tax=Noviherbaspirillum galbum TaxID=2709383 RepID=A0A6B3SVY0_9BURK|nr:YopT-type cysteine protease domain-containing protein [Noviherbaspirillum galbum]NEX64814.1 hypothetical protein [Noviherbaspirillum galbum]
MARVREVFQNAAFQNNCNFSAYGQMDAINAHGVGRDEGGGGICYGLSVVWLESKMKGTSSAFLHDANQVMSSPVFARSNLIWKNQRNKKMWQELTGLRPAMDKNGAEKQRTFELEEMAAFTAWLSSSAGSRYFLVHVPGHTMGACGSKMGKVEFFDPNGGIASSMHASRLAACLTKYFQADEVKSYKTPVRNKLILTVEKYKGG